VNKKLNKFDIGIYLILVSISFFITFVGSLLISFMAIIYIANNICRWKNEEKNNNNNSFNDAIIN